MFSDWSTPVILRWADQFMDAGTGNLSEETTDFIVDAVVTPSETSPTAGTAMQHAAVEQDFRLRTIEIPVELPLTACRLISAGREWSVIQVVRSADGRVVTLRAQVS
jgi:hypothetical protein